MKSDVTVKMRDLMNKGYGIDEESLKTAELVGITKEELDDAILELESEGYSWTDIVITEKSSGRTITTRALVNPEEYYKTKAGRKDVFLEDELV